MKGTRKNKHGVETDIKHTVIKCTLNDSDNHHHEPSYRTRYFDILLYELFGSGADVQSSTHYILISSHTALESEEGG